VATAGWLSIAVAALSGGAAAGWAAPRTVRRFRLRRTFRSGVDGDLGDARSWEARTDRSEERARREQLEMRHLRPTARSRFTARWRTIQQGFVDDPDEAILEAHALIQELMRERGYPIDNFEQRAADLSIDHPHVIENYRAAHAITVARARGEATTEDARVAFVHYRSLFEELLERPTPAAADAQLQPELD